MKSRSSRRVFLHRSATATAGLAAARLAGSLPLFARQPSRRIAAGPFKPTWESLSTYKCPDWFRDAKFGIWAHWSAQCVPEQGDWYARRMYIQGDRAYDHHVQTLRSSAEAFIVRPHRDLRSKTPSDWRR